MSLPSGTLNAILNSVHVPVQARSLQIDITASPRYTMIMLLPRYSAQPMGGDGRRREALGKISPVIDLALNYADRLKGRPCKGTDAGDFFPVQ